MSALNAQKRQLAVLAYGSLLPHPGDWLGKNMVKLIRCETPFPIEYAGRAGKRGQAPTLVRWKGGSPVFGGLLVLPYADVPEHLEEARQQVAAREGATNGKSKKIKDDLEMYAFRVIYSDFDPKTPEEELTAEKLAGYAIQSVANCVREGRPFMNGVRYLLENIEWGVVTKLTPSYREAVLNRTAASTLEDAEAKLLVAAFAGSANCQ